MNPTNPTEEYFSWCLSHPGVSHFIETAGNRIHYLEWPGPSGAPALLLIHGFMGHAHWWDFVAPALAENYRVLSMDIGGMGDSGHREHYALDDCVAEIAGVIRHAQLKPATIIGHSFGGRCTILAAHAHPDLIRHIVVVDSHVGFKDEERTHHFRRDVRPGKKHYPTLAAAKARFRLVPEETGTHPFVFDHIATHSIKQDGDGWTWKFDEKVMQRMARPAITDAEALPRLKVPMDFVCGVKSAVVSPAHAAKVAAAIPRGRGPIVVPGAFHHVPIGQPLALVAALRALLATGK